MLLQHLDEALAAIDNVDVDKERLRLKMDVLWLKGNASVYPQGARKRSS